MDTALINEKIAWMKEQLDEGWKYFLGKGTNRKLSGDIYENTLRQVLSELFPKYKYGYGLIYKDEEHKSREIDIIVYETHLFRIGELVAVNPNNVKAVINVKGYMTSYDKTFASIKENLNSAWQFNNNIKRICFLVSDTEKSYQVHIKEFKNENIELFIFWTRIKDNWNPNENGIGSITEFFKLIESLWN